MRSKCGYDGVQPYWDWTKGNTSRLEHCILVLTEHQMPRTFTTRRSGPTPNMTALVLGEIQITTTESTAVLLRTWWLPTLFHITSAGNSPFTPGGLPTPAVLTPAPPTPALLLPAPTVQRLWILQSRSTRRSRLKWSITP